jgi:hypothetical protein
MKLLNNTVKQIIYILSADEYTHIMMRNSKVPEIAALAKTDFTSDEYWNDSSDNIQVLSGNDGNIMQAYFPVLKNENRKCKSAKLLPTKSDKQDLMSQNLTYDYKKMFASLSNACFMETDFAEKQNIFLKDKSMEKKPTESDVMGEYQFKPPVVLQRSVISN